LILVAELFMLTFEEPSMEDAKLAQVLGGDLSATGGRVRQK